MDADLTYISLGAGTQSSALLVCSQLGLHGVPRADVAIFADTGDEPQYIYDYLDLLEEWSDIPILRVSSGCISREQLKKDSVRRTFIPAFTAPETDDGRPGMLMRKCTSEFKIRPIEQGVRWLMGYKFREHVKKHAVSMIGITVDEIHRMRPSLTNWVVNTYPLIDANLSRDMCIQIIAEYTDLPEPRKSACIFCPYKSDRNWKAMADDEPAEFALAAAYDIAIRNATHAGIHRKVYLHRSCEPLGEIDWDHYTSQLELWGEECSGICGV